MGATPGDLVRTLRIIIGLLLILVLTPITGLSGYAYTVGGEFEWALGSFGADLSDDPRIAVQEKPEGGERFTPKDALSTVSLLLETRYGAFGLGLQVLAWLQAAAGLILIFRRRSGLLGTIFLAAVAGLSLSAEIIGADYSSSFGITNGFGVVMAILLTATALDLNRQTMNTDLTRDIA